MAERIDIKEIVDQDMWTVVYDMRRVIRTNFTIS